MLDSHTLYWLVAEPERLSVPALLAISESSRNSRLYISPISVWELATAALKPQGRNPPKLGTGSPSAWFKQAFRATGSRLVPIRAEIALAAAEVAQHTGHKDPGDCYLIATARVRDVPVITRDQVILDIAASGFVKALPC